MTRPEKTFDAQVTDGNAYQAGQNQTVHNSSTVHHHDSGRGRAALAAVAVLAVGGLVFGLYLANRHEDRPAASGPAPEVTAQGTGVASGPGLTPVAPGAGAERIVLQRSALGELQMIDLDLPSGRSKRMTDEEWRLRDAGAKAQSDLWTTNASWAEFDLAPGSGRTAGVLKPGEQATPDSCLRAANSGSLTTFQISNSNRSTLERSGMQQDATICVVTDRRTLVAARITEVAFDDTEPSHTGRITIEVSPLGTVTG
ncbi:hypothetical protein [Kitasatospora sp. NPDC059673]|uniref:hypothetical protein n=1 Tax=Kitasatospora sp. NPDC059673 TaxID=3346901 RepID=UPI003684C34C